MDQKAGSLKDRRHICQMSAAFRRTLSVRHCQCSGKPNQIHKVYTRWL